MEKEYIIELNNFMTEFGLIKQLKPIYESIKSGHKIYLKIIYNCGNFVNSEVYIILVAFFDYAKSQGVKISANYNFNQNCDTIEYAERINFFQLMDINYSSSNYRHPSNGNFLEIIKFDYNNGADITQDAVKCLKKHFPRTNNDDTDLINLVHQTFWELNDNVMTHSDPHGKNLGSGFIYAQNYPQKDILKICVVDTGIGIHSSLTKKPAYSKLTEKEALKISLKKNTTSTSNNLRGVGLFRVDQLLEANLGKLKIFTGNTQYIRNGGHTSITTYPDVYWQGTAIFISIKKENPVSFSDILGSATNNFYENTLEEDLW